MSENGKLPHDIRQIDDGVSVCGQITADQVPAIAEAGFTAIICNRPDGEAAGQPGSASIRAEAERCGLRFYHIPVVHAGITHENVDQTQEALAEIEKPFLAFCRSGARSTRLYEITTG